PRLLLGERDVHRLAPGVTAWLERGAEPEAVRRVLAAGLPADLRSPVAVLGYRLRAGIPPELPREAPTPQAGRSRPVPMQNCDGCDRAFRAPEPGRCNDCPPERMDFAA
ncbi:DNA-binding protein, partial [Streptomyces sp. RSD-27]